MAPPLHDAVGVEQQGVPGRQPIDEGFAQLVAAVAGRGYRSPIDAVRDALLGGEPHDDACLLCLTFVGGGA